MASGGSGGTFKLILGILVILLGLGGYNYYRNWQAEEAEQGPRPLASYADIGLVQLAEGYRAEIETLEKRRTAMRNGSAKARETEFLGEGVQEFERVQRSNARTRGLTGELAEREARLREIESEMEYRQRLRAGGFDLHLSRLIGS